MADSTPKWCGSAYVVDSRGDVWRFDEDDTYTCGIMVWTAADIEEAFGPCASVNLVRQ